MNGYSLQGKKCNAALCYYLFISIRWHSSNRLLREVKWLYFLELKLCLCRHYYPLNKHLISKLVKSSFCSISSFDTRLEMCWSGRDQTCGLVEGITQSNRYGFFDRYETKCSGGSRIYRRMGHQPSKRTSTPDLAMFRKKCLSKLKNWDP